jgi:hypothetical protein
MYYDILVSGVVNLGTVGGEGRGGGLLLFMMVFRKKEHY